MRWSVTTSVSWLYFSQPSGTLRPGESFTIKVYVDHLREPAGYWSARVAVAPAGAVVSIGGYGTAPPPRRGSQSPPPGRPTPSPSGSASAEPTPPVSDPPTSVSPTPSASDPGSPTGSASPTDPGSESPPPTP
ncbi:hypothetical protein [Streptomyces shenzhenensis]|uniref:hypothetical protein n=1 Tax=Streptomyces shenzhenensis TaxID=943815 RepID=UPI0028683318|nr:hypothetical protein [Streptomyces shenzhenensis]